MIQVFLQIEECVEEYVSHPAALQIAQGYLTWRKGIHVFNASTKSVCDSQMKKVKRYLTWILGLDQVKHLAEQILEGQRFNAHPLHPLALLLIKVFQLKHGENAVAIDVHAAIPVLYAAETNGRQVVGVCVSESDRKLVKQMVSHGYPSSCVIPGWVFLVFLR